MDPRVDKLLKLPTKQKVALLVLLILAEGALMVWLLVIPKHEELTKLKAKVVEVHKRLDEDRRIAADLPRFKKEYEKLTQDLQQALTELPNQKEIPTLLTSITGAGKSAGLDFLIFRPRAEEPKDFYAAVPVDITVSGSYYQIANFFTGVSNLSRIVNITNLAFADIRSSGSKTLMRVNCLATTFRFLETKENKDAKTTDAKK
jgi:type IV pilus assembly protein PilO